MAQEKLLNSRIIHKHDIESNWIKATNFIPKDGEIIIYDAETASDALPEGRSTRYEIARIKVGNGIDNVTTLPFTVDVITIADIDEICSYTAPTAEGVEF